MELPILPTLDAALFLATVALAAGQATPDEAKAMAVKAVLAGRRPGNRLSQSSTPGTVVGTFYLTVPDFMGVIVAHGTNAQVK